MGNGTPSRNPTRGRAQPKFLTYYIGYEVQKLGRKGQAIVRGNLGPGYFSSYSVRAGMETPRSGLSFL